MTSTPNEIKLPLSAPGTWLAAQRWQNPGGAPTLAMHGWLDNSNSFKPIAPFLGSLDLVAIDLPGHGRSYHREPAAEYSFLGYLPDIIDAIDSLEWEQCDLLCHSLGAALALFVAALRPERVRRIALIDGLGPRSMSPEDAPSVAETAIEARRRPLRKRVYPTYAAAEQRMIDVRRRMHPDSVRIIAERSIMKVEGGYTWRHDPRVQLPSWMRLTEAEIAAWLRKVKSEVLLVRPESGWAFNEPAYAERAAAISKLTKVIMPGSHHVHMELSSEVAGHVTRWFAGG